MCVASIASQTRPSRAGQMPAHDAPGFHLRHFSIPEVAQQSAVSAEILQQQTALPVKRGSDRESIQAGHIYVAQRDHHLMLEPGRIRSL